MRRRSVVDGSQPGSSGLAPARTWRNLRRDGLRGGRGPDAMLTECLGKVAEHPIHIIAFQQTSVGLQARVASRDARRRA